MGEGVGWCGWVGGLAGGRAGRGGEVKGVGLFIGSILEFCRSQNKSFFERCLTSRFVSSIS